MVKITDLNPPPLPLDGSEGVPVVQGDGMYLADLNGFYGSAYASLAGYPDITSGLSATSPGKKFRLASPSEGIADAEYLVEQAPNLYNPADPAMRQPGKYISGGGGLGIDAAWGIIVLPVTAGLQYTISTNTARRVGLAFYTSAMIGTGTYVAASYDGSASNPLTVTAPATATHIAINLWSNTITEPSQVQVEQGSAATAYLAYGSKVAELTRQFAAYPLEASAYEQVVTAPNLYNPANAAMRKAGFYVSSVNGGIAPDAAWGMIVLPVTAELQYTISTNTVRRLGVAFYTGTPALGTYIAGSYNGDTSNPLTVTAPAGAAYIGINLWSSSITEPTEVQVEVGSEATEYQAFGTTETKVRADAIYPPISTTTAPGTATVYLASAGGTSSYVQSALSGATIKREFVAFPQQTNLTAMPVCLNFTVDSVNGVAVRTTNDDVAPDHILGATLGANHGWTVGTCTATAHGKVLTDQGSVWATGGNEYIIVQVIDANTLVIARRTANTAPVTGTYTHVSGATNTGNISVSAVTSAQWYPPFENYQMRVIIDGQEVTERDAIFSYRQNVQFIESYDILDRSEVVTWWEANGDGGTLIPNGDPSCTVTICYEFDRYGQLTIYRDFVALKSMLFADMMALQAGRVTGATHYYIPQTIAFTEAGNSFNYALKEVANRLSANGYGANYITPARCEATGPMADRFLSLHGSDYVFAMGFLPVGATGLSARRTNCTDFAWEVRGTSDKVYARVADKGDYIMSAGDKYSTIAYRWIGPKPTARTASYPVLTQGKGYFFADWHDVAKVDRVKLPVEFLGRTFTVYGSKNATVISDTLTGDLQVNVAATGSYGFVALEIGE